MAWASLDLFSAVKVWLYFTLYNRNLELSSVEMHPSFFFFVHTYLALELNKVIFRRGKCLDLFRVLFVEFAVNLCNIADFFQELILGLRFPGREKL